MAGVMKNGLCMVAEHLLLVLVGCDDLKKAAFQ
jgi:hypothetical protein